MSITKIILFFCPAQDNPSAEDKFIHIEKYIFFYAFYDFLRDPNEDFSKCEWLCAISVKNPENRKMPLSTGIPIYYNKNQEDVIQQASLSHLRILYYILPGVSAYRDSIKAFRVFPPCMLSYNSFSSPLQKAGSMDPVFCLSFFSKRKFFP